MSIATEISRLQTAKANIKTAIENKGVTVPSNALLDTYNTYIAQISGGGSTGLEYETGTYIPAEDIARPLISFTKTHTVPPAFLSITDVTTTEIQPSDSCIGMNWTDTYRLFNGGYQYSTTAWRYGTIQYIYRGTSTSSVNTGTQHMSYNSDNTGNSGTTYPRYWVSTDGFHPYTSSTSRYWRAGRTYKWFAVWV